VSCYLLQLFGYNINDDGKVTMQLAYHQWGSKTHEKLIFLHGMGGTGALWRPIAANLEEEFCILSPDQRGHGKSASPSSPSESPTYRPIDFGQDIIDTVEALDFKPYWLIGHSMGVRSAVAAAHLKPAYARGLILVDLGFSGMAGGGLGEGLAKFLRKLPLHFASRTEARDYMTAHAPDPSMGQYLMAVSVPDTEKGGIRFPFERDALIETIYSARDFSVRDWVHELARDGMPILVLRGAQSLVWSKEEFEAEKASAQGIPSLVFEEIEGTGHGLPFEKRAEFLARIKRFVTQTVTP
jgi:pimeloyl-ACP methyl ester carboxylesterase